MKSLRPKFSLCVASLLFGFALPAGAQNWRSIGPPGGDVHAMASDPRHSDRLFLGTTDGHIFGSEDAGEHWTLLGRAAERTDAVVTAILVDPRDSDRLYAAAWTQDAASSGGGVFESEDGGHRWHAIGLTGQTVRALVQAPSDPDRLVAGTLAGVFASRDAGRSWARISPESNVELHNVDSIAIDPANPDVLYAGTYHLPWKSLDGGANWNPIHTGMIDDSDVMSVMVDRQNPQVVYASACSGIYRSQNGASLWQKIQGIPYSSRRTQVIVEDPAHPETVYAGTTEGLWKSGDAGASWRRVTPGDWIINAIAFSAGSPGRLVLGTEYLGVIVSEDGGEHFRASNEGFNHRQTGAVAFDPQRPGRILAVLAHSREPILSTDDAGKDWTPLGSGLSMLRLKRIYASPDGWWAALEGGGLMRYETKRGVWARQGTLVAAAAAPAAARGARANATSAAAKPARAASPVLASRPLDTVVNEMAFSQTRWFAATERGLLASDDRGAHWRALPVGSLANLPMGSVRVSQDAKSVWAVSLRGLVYSADGGRSWMWHDMPLKSGGALHLELAPSLSEPEGQTLVVAAGNGLFVSRDSGATWQQPVDGLPQLPIEDMAIYENVFVVALKAGGLFVSLDRGRSWSRMPGAASLEGNLFRALAAGRLGENFLAASASDGLYSVAVSGEPVASSDAAK